MIVVVEGPSAAGKSTWASGQPPAQVVPETGRVDVPEAMTDTEHARFWNEMNCRRWAEAMGVESTHGRAICDTDPLKLHYDYCLACVGAAAWERFELGVDLAAAAIAEHRLGLADLVLVGIPDDATLERQRSSDTSRRRRNFELHRRLGPALRDWYAALDDLDHGRVQWTFPDAISDGIERDRFDIDLFRTWMEQLPRTSPAA